MAAGSCPCEGSQATFSLQVGRRRYFCSIDRILAQCSHPHSYENKVSFNINRMPIIFSHCIAQLTPTFFWMGGGHPDIKMRLAF